MHPTATRAAVLREFNAPLELTELPLPRELPPGSAIVRITSTTLCGTDAHLWAGALPSVPLPIVLGHEMTGEVVALGAHSGRDACGKPVGIGSRVVWSEAVCGHCAGCTVLREPVLCDHRGYGFSQRADRWPYAIGGLSEYAYLPPGADRIVLAPDVPDTWAASAGCAVKTVVRAYANAGGVRPGSTVAVQGAGPLGLVATAYARAAGAGQVITLGGPAGRLALAAKYGADATIDVTEVTDPDERVAQVEEMTGALGADLVLDFAGAPTANREGVLMCAKRGTHVVVGAAGPDAAPVPMDVVLGREISVVGSLHGDVGDLARALRFLTAFADRFEWDAMFSPAVGLAGAEQAIRDTQSMAAVKAVVDPGLDQEVPR
ncbi:zinc-binding dehydrogenase [Saccharothrix algeriensis]|uniref:Threonine dehydrogenase-like Zn-dependent dehydrogenase n=1 Tax=Saccharothrix algeriensis TaxID=173560 RepID=A0A8T8HZQ3_9PSEU|nr:zinc-binding dehydrogenase [Saccharothrix algeriensis]MBM7809385.1 threonine dehydrogenase-like Zn-dependent dehydrogenase [Saccharothrix algeriensis]QTR03730.1 zinc-binding dehydrogenase [Saccharothrix algeriensis]